MHDGATTSGMTRRGLLRMIGMTAASATMYQAMASLGLAAETTFTGMPDLGAAPKGTSVLILGAGIAGMVAAFELRKAAYSVLHTATIGCHQLQKQGRETIVVMPFVETTLIGLK